MSINIRALLQKIDALPPDRIAEVEDFLDFLCLREQERALVRAAAAASIPAFTEVWGSQEDEAYNSL
jgi:hypothetical protein